MKNIILSDEIKACAPGLTVIQIEAEVSNTPTGDELWSELCETEHELASTLTVPDINRRPDIAATRTAYKACGKDPNRYRPSNEQLSRRAVQGKGLYRLTTLVDIINLVSLKAGYSIGGFDADHVEGEDVILGIGRHEEPYCGIGRGPLNIEGLPVYRDAIGGIGTPTSDEERTKLSESTTHIMMLVNVYGEEMPVEQTRDWLCRLLIKYAGARPETLHWRIIKAAD
ncbi:MAG: hypothetical protein K2K26_00435 [Muribaculaceae bacterium]|nr:hypothetical protein [Muribaculaceae bacterium]